MTQSNKTDSTYGKLFEIERGLRNLAQIERVILDTASDTHKDENSSDTELSTFLNEIRQEYYVRDSMWWYIRMQLPADSAARGFDLWRSHPRWYLHRVLREDCAQQGGCCARACGCCLLPPRPDRARGAGHCTFACRCCEKARGFEFDEENFELLRDMSFLGPTSINESKCAIAGGRYDRLKTVLLFGLDQGSHKNPFKMIDERVEFKPPMYSVTAPPKYS